MCAARGVERDSGCDGYDAAIASANRVDQKIAASNRAHRRIRKLVLVGDETLRDRAHAADLDVRDGRWMCRCSRATAIIRDREDRLEESRRRLSSALGLHDRRRTAQ